MSTVVTLEHSYLVTMKQKHSNTALSAHVLSLSLSRGCTAVYIPHQTVLPARGGCYERAVASEVREELFLVPMTSPHIFASPLSLSLWVCAVRAGRRERRLHDCTTNNPTTHTTRAAPPSSDTRPSAGHRSVGVPLSERPCHTPPLSDVASI